MEAEAANKRRRVEQDSEEPPVSLDFISHLPDEMLQIIISGLPTKSVVRTIVLSKRWQSLWCTVPLNLLVDDELADNERKRVAAVNKNLAAHLGPARPVSIGRFSQKYKLDTQFDCWFQYAALRDLEELRFEGGTMRRSPPCFALRFPPTLSIICLLYCSLPDIDAASPLLFPQLMKLELYDVYISKEAALISLLDCCTALEGLPLQSIHGFLSLRIVLPTIRTIGVASYWKKPSVMMLQDLVIEAAPCLERLVIVGPSRSPGSIKVLDAPKFTLLGYTSTALSKLDIGNVALQGMCPYNLIPALRTVKVLVINSHGPSLDAVLGFLQCFPCTEKLYIELYVSKRKINEPHLQFNSLSDMECLNHLSEIFVHDYRGNTQDIKIAEFFIQNARVLKVMRLGVKNHHHDPWWVTQYKRLDINNKTSMEVDIQFGTLWFLGRFCYSGIERASLHDLSVADPIYRPLHEPITFPRVRCSIVRNTEI